MVHILSHCPFLVAQYYRFRGRDILATFRALQDVGFETEKLRADILRFPSLLSCPPDRIFGWQALLNSFGVGTGRDKAAFSALLKRAPYMYYTNPPSLFGDDVVAAPTTLESKKVRIDSDTAMSHTAYRVQEALRALSSFSLSDEALDKVVRTCPDLLLADAQSLSQRMTFLLNTLLELGKITRAVCSASSCDDGSFSGDPTDPMELGTLPPAAVVDRSDTFAEISVAQSRLSAMLCSYPTCLTADIRCAHSLARILTLSPALSLLGLRYCRQSNATNIQHAAGRRSQAPGRYARHPALPLSTHPESCTA